MGKYEPVEQLAKQVVKHSGLDELTQKLAPDLYHLITGVENMKHLDARRSAHPNSFDPDFKGTIASGDLQRYIDGMPPQWRANATEYFKISEPDTRADFSDLLGRASGKDTPISAEAKYAITNMQKAWEFENAAALRQKKAGNIKPAGQDVKSPKPKQVRVQSESLLNDLNAEVHGENWDIIGEQGQYNVGRPYEGAGGEKIESGQSIPIQMRKQGLAPHHLSELAFDLKAIQNWPRGEQLQYIRDMNSIDVYPGTHYRNWIGLFHDNTRTIQARQQFQIQTFRKEAGAAGIIDPKTGKPYKPLTKREIDNWYKKDAHGPDEGTEEFPMLGKDELTSKDPEISDAAHDELMAGSIKRDWSEILPPGKTISDIQVAPAVISRDHQEFVHGIINNLASTKRIKELRASGQWDTLLYKARINLMMKNAVEKQNVAFNIALIRINKIKKAMGKPKAKWDDILVWIDQQPERAASIGWHEEVSRGGSLLNQLQKTIDQLTAPLKDSDLQLVANVFGMAEIPKSTQKYAQWLKQNG